MSVMAHPGRLTTVVVVVVVVVSERTASLSNDLDHLPPQLPQGCSAWVIAVELVDPLGTWSTYS